MNRREFITLLGATAVTWPFATAAQQLAIIGFLHSASAEPTANLVKGFRKGLFDLGFIEGQNVEIDFRWADGQNNRLPELAADLVRRNVSVIATPGSTPAALAAKAATSTIPIVFAGAVDPVAIGLVNSINHTQVATPQASILRQSRCKGKQLSYCTSWRRMQRTS